MQTRLLVSSGWRPRGGRLGRASESCHYGKGIMMNPGRRTDGSLKRALDLRARNREAGPTSDGAARGYRVATHCVGRWRGQGRMERRCAGDRRDAALQHCPKLGSGCPARSPAPAPAILGTCSGRIEAGRQAQANRRGAVASGCRD